MPVITNIVPQKNKTERVNVFIDGEYRFGLLKETITRLRLFVGKVLSEEEMMSLNKELFFDKLLFRSYTLLSYRPRSISELTQVLSLRFPEASKELIHSVVQCLINNNLLNDDGFALWWVQQRRETSKRYGVSRIRQELYHKGIDPEIIDRVIRESSNEVNEEENAVSFALKTYKLIKSQDAYTHKQKTIQRLVRRGYSWDVAKSAYEKAKKAFDD